MKVAHLKLRFNLRTIKLSALLLLLMGAVFFTFLPVFNGGASAIKGVSISNISLSRLSESDARQLLEQNIEYVYEEPIIIQTGGGERIVTTARELGVELSFEKPFEKAFSYGQRGTVARKLYEQSHALFFGFNAPVDVVLTEHIFQTALATTFSSVHTPATNAMFTYNPRTRAFDFVPAGEGKVIDQKDFREKLIASLSMLSPATIHVVQRVEAPLVYKTGADEAREKAEDILAGMPYKIKADDTNWTVERDDLISWIVFTPRLNESTQEFYLAAELSNEEITNYLASFTAGLSTKPVNAEFSIEDGKVAVFTPSVPGRTLAIEESARLVKENIENGVKTSSLIFAFVDPQITTENINDFGITTLLGRGESDFVGSPASRRHNIKVGANKYQGVLVGPGEEFSFNELLGEVDAAAGFLPELVIKKDKTVPEYGGGLCQVSTTLFRAAVHAGLEITKRYNHSYPVVYYGKPGFDATIYPPNPDLAFRNNTPAHILLQYKIEGVKLTFEIYGKDDGRTVEVDGPYTYDEKEDGSTKAWVKQTVRSSSGTVMLEKTFYSNYKSPANYPIERNPLE